MIYDLTDRNSSIFWRLKDEHIDALQEICTIATGHAATALADFLDLRIEMGLPQLKLLETSELSMVQWRGQTEDVPFAVIFLETTGELILDIMVIFDSETVNSLLNITHSTTVGSALDELSGIDRSLVKEIGNILALRYITAMNTFVGIAGIPNPPVLFIESSATMMPSIAAHFGDFTHLLLVQCDIFASDHKLSPLILMIPDERSAEGTLKLLFGDV